MSATYLIFRLIIILTIVTEVITLLIIFILEISLVEVVDALVLESFARKPVDGARDQLLLDVFAELVVELKTLLDVFSGLLVVRGRGGRREEVEEGFGGDGLLYKTGLLSVWVRC